MGQTTIIEFLEKKGIKVDNSPSSIIEPAAYAILDKEFGGNKHIEKVNIREKINLKHESVSLDDRKENEQNGSDDGADFKNEVIIKSGVIGIDVTNVYYADISNVNLRVGLIDRWLHVGDVYISGAFKAQVLWLSLIHISETTRH